jgi:2-polyprenyl-6-methoxyphenol hydroxylase-like FAD-dependent oxidoreductase
MTLDTHQYPDMRVSTITPANMQLLQQTGAWRELQQVAPTFQHMQVRLSWLVVFNGVSGGG